MKMAAHTLSPHDQGLTLDEHRRREVEFSRGEKPQIYHAVEQADYIAIVALTQGEKFRSCGNTGPRSRPSPGNCQLGLVDPGESPADACRRELLEETGLTARTIYLLGENSPCTGRLNNPQS